MSIYTGVIRCSQTYLLTPRNISETSGGFYRSFLWTCRSRASHSSHVGLMKSTGSFELRLIPVPWGWVCLPSPSRTQLSQFPHIKGSRVYLFFLWLNTFFTFSRPSVAHTVQSLTISYYHCNTNINATCCIRLF